MLSIVTTLYKSAPYLEAFLRTCREVVTQLEISDFELICVDDGSPDDSVAWLKFQQENYPELVIVELSRNFGHHRAVMAGLAHAKGERIFLIDCDMEVAPDVLTDFWTRMNSSGADVVYGFVEERTGSVWKRWTGSLFWRIFNRLSETQVPPNIVTERLMSRRYVKALLTLGDQSPFMAGMFHWVGFSQEGMPVQRTPKAEASTYTFTRQLTLITNAITGFSARPLRILFTLGIFISLLSFGYGSFVVLRKLIFPESVASGFSAIASLIVFFCGITVSSIGLVGLYLSRMFSQVMNRPLYVVKDVWEANSLESNKKDELS
ncbi:MAG: glycosyltransferase family 2 protein [Bacteroidota bacterium]